MSHFTLKRHLNVRIFVLENKFKVTFFTKNSKSNTRPNLTLFRESSFVIAHFKFVSFPVPFPTNTATKLTIFRHFFDFDNFFNAAKANIQQMLHTYTPAHFIQTRLFLSFF